MKMTGINCRLTRTNNASLVSVKIVSISKQ